MDRRQVVTLGYGAAAAGALVWSALDPSRAAAQAVGGAIRVVFPFAPGGPGDALTRLVAERIASTSGRAAIVDNRTGADGRIGIHAVKTAQPNGDTLLVTTGPTLWLMHMVHANPGFDPYKDFAPIARLASYDFCLAVANTTGVTNLPGLIDWLKANPQKASYGMPGAGTIPHFIGTRLSKMLGIDMVPVTYRGSVPAVNDVISGHIPLSIVTVADALQQHRGATLRMVAVTGAERSPFVPDVPTLRESGIDLVGDAWYALWAPAGTPDAAVARLNGSVTQLLREPAFQERMATLGLVASGSTPDELASALVTTAAAWAPIVNETGYRIEQ